MEFLSKIFDMWKKNISFFFVVLVFLLSEISYITSIEGTETASWYEQINYFYFFLWSLPALIALGYIFVMRSYMPKAKKNTRGIIFYIVNANEKQYEAISKKFIARFEKAVNAEAPQYSVVVLDDYHSRKYYSTLCEKTPGNDGERQAKLLKNRRCCIAILIDCVNGGEGEELFCHMTTTIGVAHETIPAEVRKYLIKDISTAFEPLRNVDIMKLTETSDLSRHSVSMDIICKYILASTCFHCGDFLGAIKLLERINHRVSLKEDLPEAIIPIKNILVDRLATCYRVRAEYEYRRYCDDHDDKHLIEVRNAISNECCKEIFGNANKVFEGICSFVLDRNVDYAIQCMAAYNKKDPVIRYNKVFLHLWQTCSEKNIFRVYTAYKFFGNLPKDTQDQIEGFTFHEYNKDTTKKQLLLILFFIYDFQGNVALAKNYLDEFLDSFPWIHESKASSIFEKFKIKYADVGCGEAEMYSE